MKNGTKIGSTKVDMNKTKNITIYDKGKTKTKYYRYNQWRNMKNTKQYEIDKSTQSNTTTIFYVLPG